MEKKQDPNEQSARTDNIVGAPGSLSVHVLKGDSDLKMERYSRSTTTTSCVRSLCKDNIRAEIKTMVRQRYTLMFRDGTKSRDVRATSYRHEEEPTRRHRSQDGGRGCKFPVVLQPPRASQTAVRKTYAISRKTRHKYFLCSEPGHRRFDCTAHVIPAVKNPQSSSREIISCLLIGEQCREDTVREPDETTASAERWIIAERCATSHMSTSHDFVWDIQPSEKKAKAGNDILVDVECCASLAALFPVKGWKQRYTYLMR